MMIYAFRVGWLCDDIFIDVVFEALQLPMKW